MGSNRRRMLSTLVKVAPFPYYLTNSSQAIAFWELALITDSFPDRRKTIYAEHDRKKGPTFEQVTAICLGQLKDLITRLNIGLDPTYNPNTAAGTQQPAPSVNLVPRIAQPLRDGQIAAAPPKPDTKWEHIEAAASGIAKSQSTPGNAQQAYSREAINRGVQKAQEGAREAESFFTKYYGLFVSSPIGSLFQQSFKRSTNIVVLGAPYSRISLVCNAITALTNLTVFSLKQDELGQFHKGIPGIIRVFTTALNKLDEYMATVPIHSSDKETLSKPEAEQRSVPEVDEVRECLREGLEKILGGFTEYLTGFGMTRLEILDAKKAVGIKKAPEMVQGRQ
jgi:nucleoporin NDC1